MKDRRFLASAADTNRQWQAQASRFMGAFQVPTLRNVALRPRADFKRPYMHNGYFKDLRTVVHFSEYARCIAPLRRQREAGVTCWPAPEEPRNVNVTLTGNLGLSGRDERDLVAFMQTLNDVSKTSKSFCFFFFKKEVLFFF